MSTSTSSQISPPEVRFHRNVTEFTNLIEEIITKAQDAKIPCSITPFMIGVARSALPLVSPADAMEKFISRSHNSWEKIRSKDLQFFRTEGISLFDSIPEAQVADFNSLFDRTVNGVPLIDEQLIEFMWNFFHGSVKQAISYIHFKRDPDPVTKKYRAKYMPMVSVAKCAADWKIVEHK